MTESRTFRYLHKDLLCIVAVMLAALALPAGLFADDQKPAGESVRIESDWKPLRAEKPETDESVPIPKRPEETPEQRRERLRNQARNDLGSAANLIGIPRIQNELGLSKTQQKEISDQTRTIHLYVRSRFKDVRDLPRDQQAAELRKLQSQTRSYVRNKQQELLKILTEDQRRRLLGISLQIRGPKCLIDEEVIELLGLTEEQVEKILVILEEHDAKLRELATISPTVSAAPLVVIQSVDSRKDMDEKVEEQILEVLTDSQREKFKELQGKPYLALSTGGLPTLIEPSEKKETKTLQELVPDK